MPKENSTPRQFPGVMVSSTFRDLELHRAALIKIIDEHDLESIAMEYDSAKTIDVIESSLGMVADGSAYVGVISQKYGQRPECPVKNANRLSLTELEFNKALDLDLPILLFIMNDEHPTRKADIERDPRSSLATRRLADRPRPVDSRDYQPLGSRPHGPRSRSPDTSSESLLALAKIHTGQLPDPRAEAERLAKSRRPAHRPLAAYKEAWADGEPYVFRYELTKSRELLERLGVPIPDLPPYDPAKDPKFPWEDRVAALIEKLRAEKAEKEKAEEEKGKGATAGSAPAQ